jgi:hypothetical protein
MINEGNLPHNFMLQILVTDMIEAFAAAGMLQFFDTAITTTAEQHNSVLEYRHH